MLLCLNLKAQDYDNFSKKELKEFIVLQNNKLDSLQKIIDKTKLENHKKDSIINELNAFIVVIEEKLNKIEFESSSCKIAHDSLKTNLMSKEKEVSKLNDSLQKVLTAKSAKLPVIECSYLEEKLPDCDFPVSIKTCILNNYKNIKSGTPDFKGNYIFANDLFKKVGTKYIQVKNSDLFNAQKMELLEKINSEIKLNFEQFLNSPNGKDCLEDASAPHLTFEDMLMDFSSNRIEFTIKYAMNFSCFTDSGTTISYSIQEILPYLNL